MSTLCPYIMNEIMRGVNSLIYEAFASRVALDRSHAGVGERWVAMERRQRKRPLGESGLSR